MEVASQLYNTDLGVTILREEESAHGIRNVLVKFRLDFDNREYVAAKHDRRRHLEHLQLPPVPCSLFLKLFPFTIFLREDMKILAAGVKLVQHWGYGNSGVGKPVTQFFRLLRPRGVPFTWTTVSTFISSVCVIGKTIL